MCAAEQGMPRGVRVGDDVDIGTHLPRCRYRHTLAFSGLTSSVMAEQAVLIAWAVLEMLISVATADTLNMRL